MKFLIIADIEGSSGCLDRDCAKFMGRGWPQACLEMTRDVNSVVRALYDAGAALVHVQDFHRTGYNLMGQQLDPRVVLTQGYRLGPVPGMGHVGKFDGLVMLGMHAPSGSPGFLSHTLTSRVASVKINGTLISEAQLFAAALAPLGIPVKFFSGCPDACRHTREALPKVHCHSIDKHDWDFSSEAWRRDLASACVAAVKQSGGALYNPLGPFKTEITMVDIEEAKSIERKWKVNREGACLELCVADFNTLFRELSRLVYLSPLKEKLLPLGLPLYHMIGYVSLALAGKKLG